MVSCASNTEKGPMGKDASCSNHVLGRMVASYDREEDTSDMEDNMAGISSSYDNHSRVESLAP